MKFRIGDKVRCIDTERTGELALILYKVYTVTDIKYDRWVRIKGMAHDWLANRFILVKRLDYPYIAINAKNKPEGFND